MAGQRIINRKKFLSTSALTLATAGLMVSSASAYADDHAWVLENGGGSFSTDVSLPDTTTITQTSDRAIGIGNTSIAAGQSVNILQNGSGSLFIAKDNTGNATSILGALKANGGVMVLNQNGVLFGKDARIDVGSIVASTGNVDTSAVMHGDSKIELTNFGDASVINNGTISVAGAGLAALVAPTVVNNGIIQAKLGKIALAAGGEKATVDLYGDGLVEMTLGNAKTKALTSNTGTLEGKTVLMTAAAAKDVVDTVINMSGVIKANSVTELGGKIILNGGGGKVVVSGTVEANGATKGGSVKVKGNDVFISGIIHADGNLTGGDVTVWGDKRTYFTGYISALGANGFVETSGALLGIHGSVETGAGGQWLLDPTDIRIVNGTGDGNNFNPDDSANDSWYWLGAQYIIDALNAGTNVTIETSAGGGRPGDIVVDAAITKTAGTDAVLTMNAINDIYVNQEISSTFGKLDVNLNAGVGTGGDADVYVFNNIKTNGGDFNATASDDIDVRNNAAIMTDGGNVSLNTLGTGDGSWVWMPGNGWGTGSIETDGGNVLITTDKLDLTGGSFIDSGINGDITVNNTGVATIDADTLRAQLNGKVSIHQNAGGSIQSAIDAIKGNEFALKTVTVGDGTYNENLTLSKNNTLLQSENGRDHVTINGVSNVGALGTIVVTNDPSYVAVGTMGHGFTINGIDNGVPGIENSAVYLQGRTYGTNIVDNKIVAMGDEAITTEYGQSNNQLHIIHNTITGNTFTGADYTVGDQFTDANVARELVVLNKGVYNLTFADNTITGNSGDAHLVDIDAYQATMSGNTFNGFTTNAVLRLRPETNIDVFGNTIIGNGADKGIYATGIDNSDIGGSGTYADAIDLSLHSQANEISGVGYGIVLDGNAGAVTRTNIIGNKIDDVDTGIYVNGVNGDTEHHTGVNIEGNYIGLNGGNVTTTGVSVKDSASVTVLSNHLNGMAEGVVSDNGFNLWVYNNDITNTTLNGVHIKNSPGTQYGGGAGSDIDVWRNRITGAAGSTGVLVENSAYATVGTYLNNVFGPDGVAMSNVISGVQDGIVIKDSAHAGIFYNTITDVTGNGIYVDHSADAMVFGNVLNKTGKDGIAVIDSARAQIVANIVGFTDFTATTSAGVNNIHGDGIYVRNSDGDATTQTGIYANIVTEADSTETGKGSGINMVDSDYVTIGGNAKKANTVSNSRWDGIRVESLNGPADHDVISTNSVTNSERVGIYSAHATNLSIDKNIIDGATSAIGIPYGAISSDWGSNITVTNNTVTHSTDGILMYAVTGSNEITGNKIDDVDTGIYVNGVNGDTEHHTGVNIEGNYIGLNGGNVTTTGVSVKDSASVTVLSNHLNGMAEGVVSDNGFNLWVYNNDITNTTLNGVHIKNSPGTQYGGGAGSDIDVWRNRITGAAGSTGVLVENSAYATVGTYLNNVFGPDGVAMSNVISGVQDGIVIKDSAHAGIFYNTITDVTGNGIYVDPSDGVLISGNKITHTGLDGIKSEGNDNVTITENTLRHIGHDGINVTGGSVLIDHNKLADIGNDGIFVGDMTDAIFGDEASLVPNATISNNIIDQTGNNGVNVSNVYDSLVTGNKIGTQAKVGIGANGILISGSIITDPTVVTGNTINNTVLDGVHVDGIDDVTVSDNTITKAGYNGIGVSDFVIATISRNDITKTGLDGIHVENGLIADINNNNVYETKVNGISSENNYNVSIVDNVVALTGENGIDLDNSGLYDNEQTAYVSGNFIALAGLDGIFVTNVYGNDGAAGYSVQIVDNKIVLTERHGINVEGASATLIDGNQIALAGSNFKDWANELPGDEPVEARVARISEIPDLTLNWGNGDGIHVENVYRINNNDTPIFLELVESGDGDTELPPAPELIQKTALRISNNDVKWVGGDGIEVLGAGSARISKNTIDQTGINTWTLNGKLSKEITNAINNFSIKGVKKILGENDDVVHGDVNLVDALTEFLPSKNDIGYGTGDGIHVENVGGDFSGFFEGAINVADVDKGNYDVRIRNNTISHTGGDGIDVRDSGWSRIQKNKIDKTGLNDYANDYSFEGDDNQDNFDDAGDGIRVSNEMWEILTFAKLDFIGGGFYGDTLTKITDNKVTHTGDDGIEVAGIDNSLIDHNTVKHTGSNGILVTNYTYDDPTVISNNKIVDAGDNGIDVDGVNVVTVIGNNIDKTGSNGILVEDSYGGDEENPNTVIQSNIINNAGYNGIEALYVESSLIDQNTITFPALDEDLPSGEGDETVFKLAEVSTPGNDGILVINGSIGESTGSGFGVTTITGNGVTNAPNGGIVVHDIQKSVITGNVVTNSGYFGVVSEGGYNDSVILAGNTLTDNVKGGGRFESGDIDLTGATNTITGGEVGLQFDPYLNFDSFTFGEGDSEVESFFIPTLIPVFTPAKLNLVNNTIGTTTFANQSSYYVELKNGALFAPDFPTIENGLNATYDGFSPESVGGLLTADEYNTLEAKFQHFRDDPTLGLFFFGLVDNGNGNVDQKDLLRTFGGFGGPGGRFRVTILGLPRISGGGTTIAGTTGGTNFASFLANITPAAGGDNGPNEVDNVTGENTTGNEVSNIEPASGSGSRQVASNAPTSDSSCWSQAVAKASSGAPVDYSFGGTNEETLSQTASCAQ